MQFINPVINKTIGPYSPAVKVEQFIFTSGQIGIAPAGQLISDDFKAQTQQALKNLSTVLTAAGSSLNHVVKTTVYLTDLNNFQKFNQIYTQIFGDHKPARSTVEVSKLPAGAQIEIEAIASI